MKVIDSYSLDSPLPADSVEAIPYYNDQKGETKYFVVGTYLYDEENRNRSGSLDLYRIILPLEKDQYNNEDYDYDCGGVSDQHQGISSTQRLSCFKGPGVLDSKWWRDETTALVKGCWATSSGGLTWGSFDEPTRQIRSHHTISLAESKPAISMANDISPYKQIQAAVALSTGDVCLVSAEYDVDSPVRVLGKHQLEAWTVSFDPHQSNIVHSGGDDAQWIGWDDRMTGSTFINRYHEAGVCTIQPHPNQSNFILTGSYDRRCALWDRRLLTKKPVQVKEEATSGVWRVRWRPVTNDLDNNINEEFQVLAACMYDGLYFWDFSPLNTAKNETIHYKQDIDNSSKYLAYGCCWLDPQIALTCTFYNRQIQILKLDK